MAQSRLEVHRSAGSRRSCLRMSRSRPGRQTARERRSGPHREDSLTTGPLANRFGNHPHRAAKRRARNASNGSNAEDVLCRFSTAAVAADRSPSDSISSKARSICTTWRPIESGRSTKFKLPCGWNQRNPVPLECSISGNAVIDQKTSHFSLAYKERGRKFSPSQEVTELAQARQRSLPLQFNVRPKSSRCRWRCFGRWWLDCCLMLR